MILLRWLLSALSVMIVAYLIPGITVNSFLVALVVALVLGLVNAVLRPLLVLLTLPVTIFSLGLFVLVINGLLFLLVAKIVPGFHVDGFGPAFFGAIVLAIVGWVVNSVFGTKQAAVI